jgi:ATP-dependent Zn protease
MIKVALGGRIAEEVFFGRITTGASDDIKKCTQIAMGIVTQYGMVERLGPINYYNQEEGMNKAFSEKTGKIIDEEIRRIIDS